MLHLSFAPGRGFSPWLPVLVLILACACGAARPRSTPTAGADAAFDRVAATLYEAWLEFEPGAAVELGFHKYDGRVPDRSASALMAEIDRLAKAQGELEALDPATLSGRRPLEREALLTEIRGARFALTEERGAWRNPMGYVTAVDLFPYISRDYAPLPDRARAIVATCDAAPRFYDQARTNLEARIPRSFLSTALHQIKGAIDFVRGDVRQAMAPLGAIDPALAARVEAALVQCARALEKFQAFLEARREQANDDYALGAERFLRMLKETQGVTLDLDHLRQVADRDLEKNLLALEAAARAIDPSRPTAEVVRAQAEDKPAASDVLALATEQTETLRRLVVSRDLAAIPSDDSIEVRETPPFMRWNSAFLEAAGIFEPRPLASFYYITPPDPSWPPDEQRAYVPPRADLLFTTIHEVWPGHFLHRLHLMRNPSRILKTFCTTVLEEGWAHYVEELMWEQGVGAGDPRVRIGQLKEALLRNVRFVAAIGLHTGEVTVAQATTWFEERAFADPATARQQAVRGTFDPMYVSYTLGKLMIRKLRNDWLAKHPGATLRAFHDQFLSYGCAPLPLIRRAMLGDDSGPTL